MTEVTFIAPILFAAFIGLELWRRRFRSPLASRRESLLDVAAWAQAWFLVAPLVVYGTAALTRGLLPAQAGAWAATPVWLQFLAFLICEDMVQYWYHRSCHRHPWMWPLHKLHHTAPYMGVRIIWPML